MDRSCADSMNHDASICLAWLSGLCQRKGLAALCAESTSQAFTPWIPTK